MILGKPRVDRCGLHVLVIQDVLDEIGCVPSLDDPASHRSSEIVNTDIIQLRGSANPAPGLVDVNDGFALNPSREYVGIAFLAR